MEKNIASLGYSLRPPELGSGKANVLRGLSPLVSKWLVPDFTTFRVSEWKENPTVILDRITGVFHETLAVRSSTDLEDSKTGSFAGVFDTILNVDASNPAEIVDAVEKVILGYKKAARLSSLENQEIILQEMVTSVSMSGVATTRDLRTGRKYIVVNYDDKTNDTDSVTSGSSMFSNQVLCVLDGGKTRLRSERFRRLFAAINELEEIYPDEPLDIEFALSRDFRPILFQVRPLATISPDPHADLALQVVARESRLTIKSLLEGGSGSVFAQMSDWNPVEILGRNPRPLATSLYANLITDSVWAEARSSMGYAKVSDPELVVLIGGQPYVNVQKSLTSFVPSGLPAPTAVKLVTGWLEYLMENPSLQDKIEFDVALCNFSFDIDQRLREERYASFSDSEKLEIIEAYRGHLSAVTSASDEDPKGIGFNSALSRELRSNLEPEGDLSGSVFGGWASHIRALGTLPFARLARHSFIAVDLLRSAVRTGIISDQQYDDFFSNLETITNTLQQVSRPDGTFDPSLFLLQFGHLRPNTYEITSQRYDQVPYFGQTTTGAKGALLLVEPPGHSGGADIFGKKLQQALDSHQIGFADVKQFQGWCQQAIVLREYSKYVFSASLSQMLEAIPAADGLKDFSREELSFLTFSELVSLSVRESDDSTGEALSDTLRRRKVDHENRLEYILPPLIFDSDHAFIAPFQIARPNFVTNLVVEGPSTSVSADKIDFDIRDRVEGRIVLIERADPGFDWLFSLNIVGLVTKYGGPNSHMAVRCAEFSIPAAIGCGENLFSKLVGDRFIVLDARSHSVVGY